MAIIRPKVSGNQQGKKFGGKSNGKKGGFGGGKGGGKGGRGGGKGAAPAPAGGQWMFIPAAAAGQFMGGGAPQRATYGKGAPQRFGGVPQKGFGGGKGGQRFGKGAPVVPSFGKGARPQVANFGGKGGKGKGGGGKHKNQNPKQAKSLDKLGKLEADCKVWIGGLAQDVNRGKLHAHFKDTVKPHMFELMSKGTACIAFKTPEDAQLAIDTFNGSELGGKDIQVDVWTQKEKKVRPEGEKRERPQKKAGSVIKTSFLKGKKGNKDKVSPMKLKIKAVDHALKVWVGGLSEKTTWKQLKEHFVASGCEVDMCDMMKPGTACCTFKTEDGATSAVGIMSGTELDDSTIQVDVWTKPERREKKKKDEIKEE